LTTYLNLLKQRLLIFIKGRKLKKNTFLLHKGSKITHFANEKWLSFTKSNIVLY